MHSYVAAALLSAEYDVESDGQTYASHPLLPNISASGESFAICRQRFRKLLETYLQRALEQGESLPTIGGVEAQSIVPAAPLGQVRNHQSSRT